MKKIMVSACLLGEPCRWHGRKMPYSSTVKKYIRQEEERGETVQIISVCPEVMGGLPVPRKPVKRLKGRVYETVPDKSQRKNHTGKDVTEIFIRGASETLKKAKDEGIEVAILCKWSPSCDEKGITGRLLKRNGVKIINTF